MPFLHLLGNAPVKELLKKEIVEHTLPSPLLFYGMEGIGKGLFALECAKLLLGPSHVHKITTHNHPDVHVYSREGKNAQHSIDSIRSWIQEIEAPPFEAPCKVFIIHDAHAMLPTSSNALLKTLEEPPSDAYIFLLTDQMHEMLPTLLSRCYKIPFFPLSDAEILAHLKKHHEAEKVKKVLLRAGGSLKKAHVLLSSKALEKREKLHAFLACTLPRDYALLFSLAESLNTLCLPEEGEEHEGYALLDDLFAWYRDVALLQADVLSGPLYHEEKREVLEKFAQGKKIDLDRVFKKLEKGKLALSRHVKLKTILIDFLSSAI